MPKDSINPTKTSSWKKLQNHFNDIKEIPINKLFSLDNNRAKKLSISLKNFFFDFSKHNINEETISLFVDLLNDVDLKKSIKSYFAGDKINLSENRAVLHTALRTKKKEIIVDGNNIVLDINKNAMPDKRSYRVNFNKFFELATDEHTPKMSLMIVWNNY